MGKMGTGAAANKTHTNVVVTVVTSHILKILGSTKTDFCELA